MLPGRSIQDCSWVLVPERSLPRGQHTSTLFKGTRGTYLAVVIDCHLRDRASVARLCSTKQQKLCGVSMQQANNMQLLRHLHLFCGIKRLWNTIPASGCSSMLVASVKTAKRKSGMQLQDGLYHTHQGLSPSTALEALLEGVSFHCGLRASSSSSLSEQGMTMSVGSPAVKVANSTVMESWHGSLMIRSGNQL